MFDVLSQQGERHARVEDALAGNFPRAFGAFLLIGVAVHGASVFTNSLDPHADFLMRLGLMVVVTFLLLLLALAHRFIPRLRPVAPSIVHLLVLAQYPVEAILWGAQARELWLFFLLSHAACAVLFATSERKAIVTGFLAFAFAFAGLFFDPAGPQSVVREAGIVLVGAPLVSATEFFLARFAHRMWQKDQRILELAMQNETGLRMLSHDMANIMALARNALELGLEETEARPGQIDNETLRYFDEAHFAVTQGVGLLRAVRDYLAIFSGKKDPAVEEFPLAEVLRDVVQLWQRPARKKQVSLALSCRVDTDQSFVVGSRPLLTHTVVGNLVSNAIKFSPPGGRILVSLRLEADEDELVIEVVDQGEGVPVSRLGSIFDGSGPTSSAGTQGESGTGFGLPLVSSTLAIFGGRISVASQGGRFTLPNGEVMGGSGTTFACRVPRKRAQSAQQSKLKIRPVA